MKPSFLVKTPGLLTTLQDLGRTGFGASGIPQSGVLDPYSMRIANILVGNPQEEGVLEMTVLGPTLEFLKDVQFALAGGDLGAKLNDIKLPAFATYMGRKGDVLSFSGGSGTRSYLAVKGGFKAPSVMGSKSTYTRAKLGGFDGAPLGKDTIIYEAFDATSDMRQPLFLGELPYNLTGQFIDREKPLTVILGPQEDYFAQDEIANFINQEWTISSEFDRMGYRLTGEKLKHLDKKEIISDGISPGAIQVPGHGLPIILLADAQTTGGYPKIATVISADLPLLAHRKGGDRISFSPGNFEQARLGLLKKEEVIEKIREVVQKERKIRLFTLKIKDQHYSVRCEEKLEEK